MSKYDVIIVGSGLGGLECGAILSKEGYRVCVLEKNEQFGGCFQTYTRRGRLLDTGIHYIGSLDKGQILHQCFHYLGIMEKLKVHRLDSDVFDRIYYKQKAYDYAVGHDRFVEVLSSFFPKEQENLKRYTDLLKEVGSLISIENLRQGHISKDGLKFFGMSAAEVLESITPNRDLQQVLAGSSLLYGGVRNHSTFYHHGMINNSNIEGPYRFINGSMQVSDELINVIRNNGGTVLNNSEVTRIIVKEERVTGVVINGEEVVEAAYIISNIHPKRTFELTDKSHSIRNAYLSRINSLENSYGIFTAYLLMKEKSCRYLNHNIYLHKGEEVWYNKENCNNQPNSCMISMQPSEGKEEYTDVVSLLSPMRIDELADWYATTPEKRGKEYKAFKEEKTHEILALIKENNFELDGEVEAIYTTTPLSYRDYTATIDGSAYGIMKDYKHPYAGLISARTKLKNLLLTGQNLNVHGALGVTLTALITCAELLGEEYLAKKVGNA